MSKHLMTLSSWPIILSKLPFQCEKGNADDDEEQEEEDLLKMNILKLLLQIFIIVNINFQPKPVTIFYRNLFSFFLIIILPDD